MPSTRNGGAKVLLFYTKTFSSCLSSARNLTHQDFFIQALTKYIIRVK